uniref:RNA (guanine-9-)-methyltransferase domain-containing protein 1 n=1 Tax=Hirondellea gigas TaxID=1518452 RepID=A0A2P2HZS2_9CRUS
MAMVTYRYFRTISTTIQRYCVSTTDCYRTAQAITSRSVLAGVENTRFCSSFHQRKPYHILAGCSGKAAFSQHHSLQSRGLHTSHVLRRKFPPKLESNAKFEPSPSHSTFVDNSDTPLTDEEQILLVKTEYELMKEDGEFDVPSQLDETQLQRLVETRGVISRRKLLRHFFLIEMKNINDKERKAKNRIHANKRYAELQVELKETKHLSYGLWRNCYLIKYQNQYMDTIHHHKLVSAALYGQHLVFDNSFDSHMSHQEKGSLMEQLRYCVHNNREHINPFSLHMCNFDPKHYTAKKFLQEMPNVFMDIHTENYLDVFPKERLVYLTPHCKSDLVEYDHDAIYILGNIVDKGVSVPYTLAKAKAEGIKMRKFPIDRFVDWGTGSKSLTLDTVINILLEVKESGSWVNAFKKIPRRKFRKQVGHGKLDHFSKKIRDNQKSRSIIKSLVDE